MVSRGSNLSLAALLVNLWINSYKLMPCFSVSICTTRILIIRASKSILLEDYSIIHLDDNAVEGEQHSHALYNHQTSADDGTDGEAE